MSDIMRPIPFASLMNWVLSEHAAHGTVFGVQSAKFPRYSGTNAVSLFGETLEAPYGPAAGPNTQLAQNIIASYVAGARFFELKTVQVVDGEELSRCVNKPCITAADECYNCEWSTELTVPQAFEEYVKAWFACKLLAREFQLGNPEGFLFNMSVGYDLAGIQSPKVDTYIEEMKDASQTPVWSECMSWALTNLGRFQNVNEAYVRAISPTVSRSITESTLHGCPPDEIERIAAYLIVEKELNTYVKCNPTLLGYEFARKTLDELGFDYVAFDDRHFREDLQMDDALPMFRRLQTLAEAHGLEFGVKLTNTFPVDVTAGELPSQEMYMSGRSLYPLSLSLARNLTSAFNGTLRISYSGGADAHNIQGLFDAGIWPVTMATTVLKPGGYERFCQIGSLWKDCTLLPWSGVDSTKLDTLVRAIPGDPLYRKPLKPIPSRTFPEKLPLLDCSIATCRRTCPIRQDIPVYLKLVKEKKYAEALQVIVQRNPLPFTTGTICPHPCGDKCMRGNYDESIHIRQTKLEAAEKGLEALLPILKPGPPSGNGKKVAVIGGGPAGMAAAWYLVRAGTKAALFERQGALGGVVRYAIPEFRIPRAAIDNDVKIIEAMGVEVHLNTEITSASQLFHEGYTDVVFATGAWKPGHLGLSKGRSLDALEFLLAAKNHPETLSLGKNVAVVGGGNTAMDAARAAKRLPGVETVYLVYRRDERNMPADEEELALAKADGVLFMPLLSPEAAENGKLLCHVMRLGEQDVSGRRTPVDTGETTEIPADTVIAAVGEKIDTEFFAANGISLTARGKVAVRGETLESRVPHIYVAGDARRGPATVVEAISDAISVAQAILGTSAGVDCYVKENCNFDKAALRLKRGDLCLNPENAGDPALCLGCVAVCETCASVCPNRANISVTVPDMKKAQIVHIDGMCNECGNCAVFCPYDSRPYQDKFTLFWREEDFLNSKNDGWLPAKDGSGVCQVRLGGQVKSFDVTAPDCGLYEPIRKLILTVWKDYGYLMI